jgi:uncharacterized protein YbjT (DUF2867 family)
VARALIVGCGGRGTRLGARLREAGWEVRGTTRDPARLEAIAAAEIEAVEADPSRLGTILDLIGDVTVLVWLLGSAGGPPDDVEKLHGDRLERLLERLVDTPVRGFVYEAGGSAPAAFRARGREIVETAARTWRIPVRLLDSNPADRDAWTEAAVKATLTPIAPSDELTGL